MIKVIATDMDGTLLDEEGRIPEEFFERFEKLKEKNVKFVVASGRPYFTLYDNFKPISDELYYICDNGAYIVEQGKSPKINVIDKEYVKEIVDICDKIDGVQAILCGTKGAYHKECSKDFVDEIDKYYIKKTVVKDFEEVEDDIFKIAVCDIKISSNNSYKVLEKYFGHKFKVVVSGKLWVDLTNKDVNKGSALEKIQKDENIAYEETMVFGDFYNDIEMLGKAYYSFVMENAEDDMKQYGNFIAESNKDKGVIKAIDKYVLKY